MMSFFQWPPILTLERQFLEEEGNSAVAIFQAKSQLVYSCTIRLYTLLMITATASFDRCKPCSKIELTKYSPNPVNQNDEIQISAVLFLDNKQQDKKLSFFLKRQYI